MVTARDLARRLIRAAGGPAQALQALAEYRQAASAPALEPRCRPFVPRLEQVCDGDQEPGGVALSNHAHDLSFAGGQTVGAVAVGAERQEVSGGAVERLRCRDEIASGPARLALLPHRETGGRHA